MSGWRERRLGCFPGRVGIASIGLATQGFCPQYRSAICAETRPLIAFEVGGAVHTQQGIALARNMAADRLQIRADPPARSARSSAFRRLPPALRVTGAARSCDRISLGHDQDERACRARPAPAAPDAS